MLVSVGSWSQWAFDVMSSNFFIMSSAWCTGWKKERDATDCRVGQSGSLQSLYGDGSYLTKPLPILRLNIDLRQHSFLSAPKVLIRNPVERLNSFGDCIGASTLNATDKSTYTLWGIAIQLLSFLNSEHLEQESVNTLSDMATTAVG